MNQDILCNWLGLPKSAWPPDPWTLLGVSRGEPDSAVIEQRVHECMCKLRCYQLSYPEEATEGMNRLAEAFLNVTQCCTKPAPVTAKAATVEAKKGLLSKDETSITSRTKLDWRDEPPPVRAIDPQPAPVVAVNMHVPSAPSLPEVVLEEGRPSLDVLVAQPFVAPARPRRSIDSAMVRELAEQSDEATSNLGTLDAVIERVDSTRRLLHSWDKVGKFLKATRKVTTKESDFYAKRLQDLADAMQTYPAILGHPGKPGYRVVVLARLKMPLLLSRSMGEEPREELLFDWEAGRQILLAHRRYLLAKFKSLRHRSSFGLAVHAIRATLNDYQGVALISVGVLLTLGLAGAILLACR